MRAQLIRRNRMLADDEVLGGRKATRGIRGGYKEGESDSEERKRGLFSTLRDTSKQQASLTLKP